MSVKKKYWVVDTVITSKDHKRAKAIVHSIRSGPSESSLNLTESQVILNETPFESLSKASSWLTSDERKKKSEELEKGEWTEFKQNPDDQFYLEKMLETNIEHRPLTLDQLELLLKVSAVSLLMYFGYLWSPSKDRHYSGYGFDMWDPGVDTPCHEYGFEPIDILSDHLTLVIMKLKRYLYNPSGTDYKKVLRLAYSSAVSTCRKLDNLKEEPGWDAKFNAFIGSAMHKDPVINLGAVYYIAYRILGLSPKELYEEFTLAASHKS